MDGLLSRQLLTDFPRSFVAHLWYTLEPVFGQSLRLADGGYCL